MYKLENIQIVFFSKVARLRHVPFWDRLVKHEVTSIERLIERYQILYTMKILLGIVPNCGLEWERHDARGLCFKTPKVRKYFTACRESSFSYTCTRLFNMLPRYLRDDTSSSMEEWKSMMTFPGHKISTHLCVIL